MSTSRRCSFNLVHLFILVCSLSSILSGGQAAHVLLRTSDAHISSSSMPSSIAVKEGETFELICESDVDNSTIVLKHHGVPFRNSSNPGVSWTVETTRRSGGKLVSTSRLKIDSVTMQDYGLYECQPEDDILDEQLIGIRVKITLAKALRIYTDSNSSLTIEVDNRLNVSEFRLSLRCDGEFASDPVWLFNGHRLAEGVSSNTTELSTSISVFAKHDQNIRQSWLMRQADHLVALTGRYQCIDANKHLSNSEVINVSRAVAASAPTWMWTVVITIIIIRRSML